MARSITFVVSGDVVDTRITVTEQSDGSLRYDLQVLDYAALAASDERNLSSIYLDVNDDSRIAGLSIVGPDVTNFSGSANQISPPGLSDSSFDIQVDFGGQNSTGNIGSTSFEVRSSGGPLSLEFVSSADVGVSLLSDFVVGSDGPRSLTTEIGSSPAAIQSDELLVNEDQSNTGNILANDTDSDVLLFVESAELRGQPLVLDSAQTVTTDGGRTGTLTIAADGTVTFDATDNSFDDLASGETDTLTITYTSTRFSDSEAEPVATADVVITINGVNDAPTLAPGALAAVEDGPPVDLDLAALGDDIDSDDDGATLSFAIVGAPDEGSASISGTTLTFDPGEDFQDLAEGETRDVVVQVQATDSPANEDETGSAVADVTVTVTGVNDAPTLAPGALAAVEDGPPVDLDLADLADDPDSDDDGATLTFAIVGAPAEGSATISGTTLTFDPGEDFQDLAEGETRNVVVQVQATDSLANEDETGSAVADVTVTVTGVNDAPTLAPGALAAVEDGPPVDLDLADLADDPDSDDDGATLTFAIVGAPAEGSATISGTTLTFDPGEDFQDLAEGETRNVVVQVQATDSPANEDETGSAVADVTVTVTGVNDAPTLAPGALAAVEDGPPVDLDLAELADDPDSDDDGATLTFAIVAPPAEGSAAIAGSTLTFDPGDDFQDLSEGATRNVIVQVQATDSLGAASNVADTTVAVTGVNDAPTLAAGTLAAAEDGEPVTLDLAELGDDPDSEGGGSGLTYTIIGAPAEGLASISGSILTFDPEAEFQDLSENATRDVIVQVQATDADGASSDVVDMTVTVTGVNDAPEFTETDSVFDFGPVSENQAAGVVVGQVTVEDVDAEDSLAFEFADGSQTSGPFAIDRANGTITTTGPLDFETQTSFTLDVVVRDRAEGGFTDTAVVNVSVGDVSEIATVVDFEIGHAAIEAQLPANYGGLSWSASTWVMNTGAYGNVSDSGYARGTTSGSFAAFTNLEQPITVSATNGQFDFVGASLTAAWNDNLNVAISGFRGGAQVFSQNIVISDDAPARIELNWTDLDSITFRPFGGTDAGTLGTGQHLVIDDFTFFA